MILIIIINCIVYLNVNARSLRMQFYSLIRFFRKVSICNINQTQMYLGILIYYDREKNGIHELRNRFQINALIAP